jgi:bacillithiol biosynthesis cysteine-adding enzyme BshC
MECKKIDLKETNSFSKIFIDYINQDLSLAPFYDLPPTKESFKKIIEKRTLDNEKREILTDILNQQYSGFQVSEATALNIERLKEKNTYTITTGHQLNIFTGPLYFIYKILTVINACEILNKAHPDHHFIPVYWMASEDHDIDEIRSFSLFAKKYTWDTGQTGPVGRMDPGSLKEVLEMLPERSEIFEKAYLENDTLAKSVRYYVNELFGDSGLIVIDADNGALKSQIIHVLRDDLLDHHANDLVESTSAELAELGYKSQVYPRAINLFYISGNIRKRIIKEAGVFKVFETDLAFTEDEILKELESSPEKFSPNVILRPLYQEVILPNVAYVGGPAEVAYWLQLKSTFAHFGIQYPILLPRNFALIINKGLMKKMRKLMISAEEIIMPVVELKNKYMEEHREFNVDLESEIKIMEELFESVRNKSKMVDQSLEGFVQSERAKVSKSLENIGKRINKSEEQKQSVALNQIQNLKDKLFPEGGLQERTDNFLNFYINNPGFLEDIKKKLDPFDYRFNIIYED